MAMVKVNGSIPSSNVPEIQQIIVKHIHSKEDRGNCVGTEEIAPEESGVTDLEACPALALVPNATNTSTTSLAKKIKNKSEPLSCVDSLINYFQNKKSPRWTQLKCCL